MDPQSHTTRRKGTATYGKENAEKQKRGFARQGCAMSGKGKAEKRLTGNSAAMEQLRVEARAMERQYQV